MCTVSERLRRALAASSLACALSAPAVVIADDTIALLKDVNPGYLGDELWSFSPATGEFLQHEINPGSASSSPVYLTSFQGALYFRASDVTGYALWKLGPTGVELVKRLTTAYYGGPDNLVVFGDGLYFVAEEPLGSGRRLWRTDGTPEGTTLVGPPGLRLAAPEELVSLTPFGDRLFFAADDVDHPHGTELWTSDGNAEVPAGTHQVGDLYAGGGSS